MPSNMEAEKVVEEAMARIEHLRLHQEAVMVARHYLAKRGDKGSEMGLDLSDRLHELELHEWRETFMWGLALDKEKQERIRAAAHQRFLADAYGVSKYMNDGIMPRKWLVSDDKEFREMAKKAFAPSEDDDDGRRPDNEVTPH